MRGDEDEVGMERDGEALAPRGADSSLARMLNVLGLFSIDASSLTVDDIAVRLGVPRSTAYRYVQELSRAGLLVKLDRSITLGPRIIELDRCIRECDPVLRAAVPAMRALAEQTGLEVFISKLYGHSVMAIHTESAGPQPPLRYGRGRPIPVTRGSSSKALVAFLPMARLRRLYQSLPEDGLPSWEVFYDEAQQIRRAGFCRTTGELNHGRTGITAPIFGRARLVVASVTALGSDARMALFNEARIAQLVMETAEAITLGLAADAHL